MIGLQSQCTFHRCQHQHIIYPIPRLFYSVTLIDDSPSRGGPGLWVSFFSTPPGFCNRCVSRMGHRWRCVICTAGHKRQYGCCLALLLFFQPWNQDSTLWGSPSCMEKPHVTVPADIPTWALADYQHPPMWEQTELRIIPAFKLSSWGPRHGHGAEMSRLHSVHKNHEWW